MSSNSGWAQPASAGEAPLHSLQALASTASWKLTESKACAPVIADVKSSSAEAAKNTAGIRSCTWSSGHVSGHFVHAQQHHSDTADITDASEVATNVITASCILCTFTGFVFVCFAAEELLVRLGWVCFWLLFGVLEVFCWVLCVCRSTGRPRQSVTGVVRIYQATWVLESARPGNDVLAQWTWRLRGA